MRKLLGQDLRDRGRLRGPVRAQRAGGAGPARRLRARRRHPRHPHAADGRAGLPRPHHGRASLPGGDGVVADRGRRRRDPGGPAAGRGRLRRQAGGRDLASHRRAAGRAGRQGARRGRRQDQVERAAEGARPPPHRRRRRGAPTGRPRAVRADSAGPRPRGDGLVLVGNVDRRAAGAGSAADAAAGRFSLADRGRPAHAGHLHRRAGPPAGRRSARSPSSRSRARSSSSPAPSISAGATPTSSSPGAPSGLVALPVRVRAGLSLASEHRPAR